MRRTRGQGLTEYAMLLVGIVLLAIIGATVAGGAISTTYQKLNTALGITTDAPSPSPSPVPLTYAQTVTGLNPIGYWRLGEAPGATVAVDSSGGGHNGTYVGNPTLGAAGLLTGDSDTAVTLNGSSQYVAYSTAVGDLLSGTAPFTLGAIVDIVPDGSWRAIVATYSGSASGGVDLVYTSGHLAFERYDVSAGTDSISIAGGLSAGRHHVIGTYDGSTMILYVDGSPVGSPKASTRTVSTGLALRLGGSPWSYSPLLGTIDEPAIWNRALTPAEIAELYRIGSGT